MFVKWHLSIVRFDDLLTPQGCVFASCVICSADCCLKGSEILSGCVDGIVHDPTVSPLSSMMISQHLRAATLWFHVWLVSKCRLTSVDNFMSSDVGCSHDTPSCLMLIEAVLCPGCCLALPRSGARRIEQVWFLHAVSFSWFASWSLLVSDYLFLCVCVLSHLILHACVMFVYSHSEFNYSTPWFHDWVIRWFDNCIISSYHYLVRSWMRHVIISLLHEFMVSSCNSSWIAPFHNCMMY